MSPAEASREKAMSHSFACDRSAALEDGECSATTAAAKLRLVADEPAISARYACLFVFFMRLGDCVLCAAFLFSFSLWCLCVWWWLCDDVLCMWVWLSSPHLCLGTVQHPKNGDRCRQASREASAGGERGSLSTLIFLLCPLSAPDNHRGQPAHTMAGNLSAELARQTGGKAPEEVKELTLDGIKPMTLSELSKYPNLTTLSLNGTGLTTLEGFPTLIHLKNLDLADNALADGCLDCLLYTSPSPRDS